MLWSCFSLLKASFNGPCLHFVLFCFLQRHDGSFNFDAESVKHTETGEKVRRRASMYLIRFVVLFSHNRSCDGTLGRSLF